MPARYKQIVEIQVRNGDALENNRDSGKSNTGTYFLGNTKFYSKIIDLFNSCENYILDKVKIREYKQLFIDNIFQHKDNYPDKLANFTYHIDELLSQENDLNVEVRIRTNDSRHFFRFKDNNNEIVYNFRSILYGEFTSIVLEFEKNHCKIYPIISDYDYFNKITFVDC